MMMDYNNANILNLVGPPSPGKLTKLSHKLRSQSSAAQCISPERPTSFCGSPFCENPVWRTNSSPETPWRCLILVSSQAVTNKQTDVKEPLDNQSDRWAPGAKVRRERRNAPHSDVTWWWADPYVTSWQYMWTYYQNYASKQPQITQILIPKTQVLHRSCKELAIIL